MQMVNKKNLIIYFSYLFGSYLFMKLVDKIYTLSVYSDLDYLQQLFKVDHKTRYIFFVIIVGSCLFVFNYFTLIKLKVTNEILSFMSDALFNFLFIFLLLAALRVNNISKILLVIFCITISASKKIKFFHF
jgi:hypothetical protein